MHSAAHHAHRTCRGTRPDPRAWQNPMMPVGDWADPRDTSYFLWKKKSHGEEAQGEAAEAELKAKVGTTPCTPVLVACTHLHLHY